MRRLLVLSLFLFSAPLFAAGREITAPVLGLPPYSLFDPQVTTNGATFLTVWVVQRDPSYVFGSLADADGRVLTPVPFPIGPTSASVPQIVPYGSGYLAVFPETRGTLPTKRIATDGTVTDGPVLRGVKPYGATRVATNGNSLLVVTPSLGSFGVVFQAHLFTLDGKPVKLNIPIATVQATFDATAMSNGEYAVIVSDQTAMFAIHIDADGNARRSLISGTASVDKVGVITADPGVVVWTEWFNNEFAVTLHSAALREDIIPATHDLGGPIRPSEAVLIDLAPFGDTHLVVAERMIGDDLLLQLSGDGQLLTSTTVKNGQRLATNASTAYVIGQKYLAGAIYGTAVHALNAQSIDAPQLLSLMEDAQTQPAIASDGINFLAKWAGSGPSWNLGTAALTSGAVRLGDAHFFANESSCSKCIAWNGSQYVVATYAVNDSLLRFFDRDGTPQGQTALPGVGVAALAADGSRLALLTTGPQWYSLTFVDADGRVSAPIALPSNSPHPPAFYFTDPQIAFDGTHYLVTFAVGFSMVDPIGFPDEIDGVLISRDGSVMSDPFVIASQSSAARVATDGHGFMVAVQRYYGVLRLVPVTVDGDRPIAGNARSVFEFPTWFSVAPDIAATANGYVVTWSYGYGLDWRLAVAQVERNGNIGPISIAPIGSPERGAPSIAANAAGAFVVVNSDVAGAAGSARIRAYRADDFAPIPPPPAPPTNVAAFGANVTWASSDASVMAFVIEGINSQGDVVAIAFAPADARSITLYDTLAGPVRVRALGAGGLSAPTNFVPVTSPPRRRAAR